MRRQSQTKEIKREFPRKKQGDKNYQELKNDIFFEHKSSLSIDFKNRNLRVAVLLGPRLGNSLMMMTVAQNLRAAGIQHDIFGDYMVALADWFPGLSIFPSLTPENLTERLVTTIWLLKFTITGLIV